MSLKLNNNQKIEVGKVLSYVFFDYNSNTPNFLSVEQYFDKISTILTNENKFDGVSDVYIREGFISELKKQEQKFKNSAKNNPKQVFAFKKNENYRMKINQLLISNKINIIKDIFEKKDNRILSDIELIDLVFDAHNSFFVGSNSYKLQENLAVQCSMRLAHLYKNDEIKNVFIKRKKENKPFGSESRGHYAVNSEVQRWCQNFDIEIDKYILEKCVNKVSDILYSASLKNTLSSSGPS